MLSILMLVMAIRVLETRRATNIGESSNKLAKGSL
jgi:hypothetical protein